jgi:hypothetical protein
MTESWRLADVGAGFASGGGVWKWILNPPARCPADRVHALLVYLYIRDRCGLEAGVKERRSADFSKWADTVLTEINERLLDSSQAGRNEHQHGCP